MDLAFCRLNTAVVLLAVATSLAAEPKKGPVRSEKSSVSQPVSTWSAEPSAVAGIRLGVPLSESALPSCQVERGGIPVHQGPMCVHVMVGYEQMPQVLNTPIGRDFFVGIEGGVVSSVSFSFEQESFDEVLNMLTARYGLPTSEGMDQVRNLAGGVFDSKRAEWMGRSVSLSVYQRQGQVDTGIAFFGHIPTLKAAQERKSQQGAEQAKGL